MLTSDTTKLYGTRLGNIFSSKILYIDTNIIYYCLGINGEEYKKANELLLDKCLKAKEKLRITKITELEFANTLNHYIEEIKKRMKELGLEDEVDFTGRLATHDDVIKEVRKARFAVLPLKVDLISGTIREAMANGLPVVTTITPATPQLNEKRGSILLSEKGDFKAMAENMCRLLEDENFAERIRQNAATTISEKYSNTAFMNEWRERYYEIVKINHEKYS